MATRDHLGLQVGLIISVILVIALGVFSYMSWTKAKSDEAKATQMAEQAEEANRVRDQFQFRYSALEFMITEGLVIKDVDPAKDAVKEIQDKLQNELSTKAPGALNEPKVKTLAENYYRHMAAFGSDSDLQRNYSNLPDYLMQVVGKKNQEYKTLSDANKNLIGEKNSLEVQLQTAKQEFNDKVAKLENEKQQLKTTFDEERTRITKEKEQFAAEARKKDEAYTRIQMEKQKSDQAYQKQIVDMQKVARILNRRLADYERASFENPDGFINVVNHRLRLCYVDVGSEDGVRGQMTFSVYGNEQSEVMIDHPKGSIEVVKVIGPHQTLCRIIDDDIKNMIRERDIIHTPAWDPGRPVHITIAGFVDINEDGKSDKDLVRTLIEVNGGVVDATVNPETRFLILGAARSNKPGAEMTARESATYRTMIRAATDLGVDRISASKLVSYMGWRGDVKVYAAGNTGEGGLGFPNSKTAVKDPQAIVEQFKKELEWEQKKRFNPARTPTERVEEAGKKAGR